MANEHILVVDDEPDVLEIAVLSLEMEGYVVVGAGNGTEAIAAAERAAFDLVLTDIKMPDIDGLTVYRTIAERQSSVVGVAMTGYNTVDIVIQALQLGFTDFIVKPFDPAALALRINAALERAQMRRENQRLQALLPLLDLSGRLMTERQLESLLLSVSEAARDATGARSSAVVIPDSTGITVGAATDNTFRRDAAWFQIAKRALLSPTPLHLRTTLTGTLPKGISEVIAVSLNHKGQQYGVLLVAKRLNDTPFSVLDNELLFALAGQAAVAIANATLFEEREKAYTELAKLDQMKSDFINIATHELRTPLALMLGYGDFLREMVEGESLSFVEAILQNGQRLRGILDDMVQLHRIEINHAEMVRTPTDLVALLNRVIERLQFEGNAAPVIVREFPDNLPPLMLDARKIELVFTNLLMNAAKYGPRTGRVVVGVALHTDEVVVWVTDEGPGIVAAEQQNVWKRFYQVGPSISREYGGMGLGLSLVKGMVELHGGRAWVQSDGQQGSTFYFSLPIEQP